MIGSAWTTHRAFSGADCSGTLRIVEQHETNPQIWIAECDGAGCRFELGVHESRLDGPRSAAPQDRVVESQPVAESW